MRIKWNTQPHTRGVDMRFALILTQLHFSYKNPLNEHELLLCESITLMSHSFQIFIDKIRLGYKPASA